MKILISEGRGIFKQKIAQNMVDVGYWGDCLLKIWGKNYRFNTQ
jgi:hypothetical protein